MKISSIKQQQKRNDRYSIYVDGTYLFSLSELELVNSGLRINQEVSQAELSKLKDTAALDKAYDRSLNLIARRPHSAKEMQDYLKRKGYDEVVSEKTLNRLSNRGFLNDRTFAKLWVDNRRALKAISKRRLQQELKAKGIDQDMIDEVLAQDETNDREVLKELIARKRRQPKYQDDIKLMQYLSRQGFSYEDIKSALQQAPFDEPL